MTLEDAIAASTVRAAAFPTVEDIIRCENGATWWWLQTRYVQRDRPLSPRILASNDWHPVQPIELRMRNG